MQIGILKTTETGRDIDLAGVCYGKAFETLLGKIDGNLHFSTFRIADGHELPPEDSHDAYLITGSPWGCHDTANWIEPLSLFLRRAYQLKKRMLGICFGHQILAHSLGGTVITSEKGMGLGVRQMDICIEKEWMSPAKKTLELHYSHFDQVSELPAEAQLLAGDEFCPIGMFCIGSQILSCQGHPEFEPSHMAKLVDGKREQIGDAKYFEARDTLRSSMPDSRLLAEWMVNFLSIKE